MSYNKVWLLTAFVFLSQHCVGTSTDAGVSTVTTPSIGTVSNLTQLTTPNGSTLTPLSGNNVMALSVNTSPCAADTYLNKPCVSVKVCDTSGGNCQTINDILLDTGSYGLRIFKSAFSGDATTWLTQVNISGSPLAECVHFGDGSGLWGSVRSANVMLANEGAAQVPIQLVDANFASYRGSSICSDAETSPSEAGLNGILGVGLLAYDCGTTCQNSATVTNPNYYTCNGTNACTATMVPTASQVQNPAAMLPADTGTAGHPQDNNGLIIVLPSVPPSGAPSVQGYVVFGIGTRANNTPTGSVIAYAANTNVYFRTNFNGTTYTDAFIDSGSNALYFVDSGLTSCSSVETGFPAGWYCPPQGINLSATTSGTVGTPSVNIAFQIGSLLALLENSANNVFSDAGGDGFGDTFDWGLPFFLGRNVYVGFENASSSLGSGRYWAY